MEDLTSISGELHKLILPLGDFSDLREPSSANCCERHKNIATFQKFLVGLFAAPKKIFELFKEEAKNYLEDAAKILDSVAICIIGLQKIPILVGQFAQVRIPELLQKAARQLTKNLPPTFLGDLKNYIAFTNQKFGTWCERAGSEELDKVDPQLPDVLKGSISPLVVIASGGAVTTVAVNAMLPILGFTSSGVASGSFAAAWMSSIGSVSGGSLFAMLQSAGVIGFSTMATGGIALGGMLLTGLGYLLFSSSPSCSCKHTTFALGTLSSNRTQLAIEPSDRSHTTTQQSKKQLAAQQSDNNNTLNRKPITQNSTTLKEENAKKSDKRKKDEVSMDSSESMSKREALKSDKSDQTGDKEVKLPKKINSWSTNEVSHWLESMGFGDFVRVFDSHNVDGEALLLLKDSDYLVELVPKVGDRLKLQQKLKELFP